LSSTLAGHKGTVWGLAFAPDGKALASAAWDGTIRLWDLSEGEASKVYYGLDGGGAASFRSVAFSPDGKMLATGDGGVKLWDVGTGAVRTLRGHVATVSSVAFSPDGRTLLSGGMAGEMKLWDVATGEVRATLWGRPRAEVWAVAYSPDGSTIVSGSQDGTIKLWDAKSPTTPEPGGPSP
jgi:WD40 repeat protein